MTYRLIFFRTSVKINRLFRSITGISLLICILSCDSCRQIPDEARPNILFILADDLGYGDVSAFNPELKIQTPNIDMLARGGIRFTDAHSPHQYALLPGTGFLPVVIVGEAVCP